MNEFSLSSLTPKSVAVIGGSDNHNKPGGRPIYYMRKFGFKGNIFPVNPARTEVQGLRCFAGVDDLPEKPDAAIIAVESSMAVGAVAQCARRGIATAIVMTAGFAEMGEEGARTQRRMVDDANAHGMRIVGPNAQGIANFATGSVLNFSTMFMDIEPLDGPIALVSQSGAASVMPYANLRQSGMGVRYLIATGNDADLGVSELTRTVAADREIKLILVYMEAVNNPGMLADAARIAGSHGAKIVLLKGGNSKRGALASATHTGALMVDDGAFDAFLRHHGIWRARDIHEMVNAAPLYLAGFDPGRGRTIVMSHSGAVGVMCADAAERADLALAELSPETLANVDRVLPNFGTASNPLDLTAAMLGKTEMFPQALDVLGRDPQGDMFLISIPVAGPGYDVPAIVDATKAFSESQRKPLAASAPQDSVRNEFKRRGVPIFRNEIDAINALGQYSAHMRWRPRPDSEVSRAANTASHHGLLDEADSLRLLREAGVPVVPHAVCGIAEDAVAAFSKFGGRVAVKGCAAEVAHKTEHGLVHLNLATAETVRTAAADCLAKLAALGVKQQQVLVAPMIKGLHEFVLGVLVDPTFGVVVLMGDGGTLVEVRKDIVSLLAPFTPEDAVEALQRLRIAPLFAGFRNMPPLDIGALAKAAVALGDFALAHRNSLLSVDINPIVALAAGKGVMALDAVVEFKVRP
ncbi:acetate--CoA ligase family protein [Bradyrhizobium sp. dw_411]|uniref:acetate--CoA ligase family protein n=1 Tax=Bradyrhizobium sp. dw_411 TaxID=2720082 RepID=UPI001BCBBD0C|nr:acetate--CoA ligase family protein [Bradyrhizobium sp. dw_411]